jgi:hypothetical protein
MARAGAMVGGKLKAVCVDLISIPVFPAEAAGARVGNTGA